MKRRTILLVPGALLLTAALGYAVVVIRILLTARQFWFLTWYEILPLALAGLVGSVSIVLGSEDRRLAGHGFACLITGLGIIGTGTLTISSSRLFSFFGCLVTLLQVLWLITGLALVSVGAVLSITAALKGLFAPPPAKPGHCGVCGYNRRGLPRRRCPECGTPF